MYNCIFCDAPLTADTPPEHILLSALGGRKSTTQVDCSQCNGTFGSTIDKAVADQVAVLRNMLGLESGAGKPPPAIRRVKAGNDRINFNKDGTLDLVRKPFAVTTREDGATILNITARSIDEIAAHIPNIAAMLKLSEEKVIDLIGATEVKAVSRRPGIVHFPISLGGEQEVRSFLKSCLVLWATRAGSAEVKSAAFAAARSFVRHGDTAFNRDRVHFDSRDLPHLEELTRRYGDFFNLIYIRSDAEGRAVGHFTLYNVISWQMVLAESGASANRKIGLISNPMNPATWSDSIADEVDIDFAWLNAPDSPDEFVRARERLSAAVARSQQDAMSREFDAIIRAVFEKHGVKDISPSTEPELFKHIVGEISQRVAHHVADLPYEEKIEGAALMAKLRAARKPPGYGL